MVSAPESFLLCRPGELGGVGWGGSYGVLGVLCIIVGSYDIKNLKATVVVI